MVYLLYWLITPRKTPRVGARDGWGSGDLEPAIAPEPLPFLVALVRDAVGRAVVADAELRH